MESKKTRKQNMFVTFAVMTVMFIAAIVLALLFGGTHLTPSEVFAGLVGKAEENLVIIVQNVRMPRVFAAVLAGIGLSVSGTLLQGVTDNGLASPNLIGVNSGAGLMTILVLCFFPTAVYALPVAAFVGAFAATLLIVWTAGKIGSSKSTIILAGIALTTILNAAISFISLLDTDVVAVYNYFSIGGLQGVQGKMIIVPAIFIAVSLVAALLLSPRIAVLCLGDSIGASLGVRVKSLRVICLICASASAAAVVSFAGLLGFVGLIVPHIGRRIVGGNMTRLLAASSIIGATIVLLADMLGRTLFAPTEVPVGIVMALIGAPFFLMLLLKRRGEHA